MHAHHAGHAALVAGVGGAVLGEVEVLQNAQRLRDGDAARRRWRHGADVVAAAVGGAHRLALFGLVVLEVGDRHQAGGDGRLGCIVTHRLGGLGHDGFRQRAGIHGIGPAGGQGAQRLGVRQVGGHGARGLGRAVGVEVGGHGIGVKLQVGSVGADRVAHAARDFVAR